MELLPHEQIGNAEITYSIMLFTQRPVKAFELNFVFGIGVFAKYLRNLPFNTLNTV